MPTKQQDFSYSQTLRKCWTATHEPILENVTSRFNAQQTKRVKKIVGSVLHVTREVELTMPKEA